MMFCMIEPIGSSTEDMELREEEPIASAVDMEWREEEPTGSPDEYDRIDDCE